MREVKARPKASVLIESMRDIGYRLETALADIVDNSITAGATEVDLFSNISTDDLKIAILDNGMGMTESELIEAMRPGSRSPLEHREAADLGRFGLGLKTASFSQCRRVTVVSRKKGDTSVAIWDLDRVAEVDDWVVQIPDDPLSIPWADHLTESGTLVVWDKLDRLTETAEEAVVDVATINEQLDIARSHLELVFHRYLSGESGLTRVRMSLNGNQLVSFDPFNPGNPATIVGPVETILVSGHPVLLQTFTLPHHKKVTPGEWERYGGPDGYLKNQGFYVYREKRLIVHGSWFGLARQTELTKLARVRIDTPNELDTEWKIDVKKASAQPPRLVRERLRRIIETIGATSKRVYTQRGRRLVNDNRLPVWIRSQDKGQISYAINQEHPVYADLIEKIPEDMKSDFRRAIDFTGSTLPIDALYADFGNEPNAISVDTTVDDVLEQTAITTFRHLTLTLKMPESAAIDMIKAAEPFQSNWEVVQRVLATLELEEDSGS
jgi:hypothetical protein